MYRWLLYFEIAGSPFRYSTESVVISSDDGELFFSQGLGDLTLGKDYFRQTSLVNISITSNEDWIGIAASSGWLPEGGIARLFWWKEGDTFEKAALWLEGEVSGMAFSQRGEPLSFSIVREGGKFDALNNQAVIDASTQPRSGGSYQIPEKSQGQFYPIIIGYPGWDETISTPRPVVPVPISQHNSSYLHFLAVANGRIDAGTVRAHNVTENYIEDLTVNRVEDLLGREYSELTTNGSMYASGTGSRGDTEWCVGFSGESGYGGGIVYKNQVLRGASDIVEYMVKTYTDVPIDTGRMNAYRGFINAFKFDTFINEQVDVFDWLEDSILKWIPGRLCESNDGIWIAPIRYDATKKNASLMLDASNREIVRVSNLASVTEEIVNEVVVEFCPNRDASTYLQRRIITDQWERTGPWYLAPDQDRRLGSLIAKASQSIYGVRSQNLQLFSVWDKATAINIGNHALRQSAFPYYRVTYRCPVDPFWKVDIGEIGTLTDEEISLDSALFLVNNVAINESDVELELILLRDDIVLPR